MGNKLFTNFDEDKVVWAEVHTKSGEVGFLCGICGFVSFHPKDLEHRYCGNCHKFIEAEWRRDP